MQLLERTQELLNRATEQMSLREIAEGSDGAVPYDWLKRFAIGDIPNPGVKYLQALHDCLKRKRLDA
jgi:hypothetical protein